MLVLATGDSPNFSTAMNFAESLLACPGSLNLVLPSFPVAKVTLTIWF